MHRDHTILVILIMAGIYIAPILISDSIAMAKDRRGNIQAPVKTAGAPAKKMAQ